MFKILTINMIMMMMGNKHYQFAWEHINYLFQLLVQ